MKLLPQMKAPTRTFALVVAALVVAPQAGWVAAAMGAQADVITAVSSQTSEDYVRQRATDGSLKPETFTFGEGGFLPGAARDDSIDKLTFLDVAKVLSEPLAAEGFVPVADRDPNKTGLLIIVYWGKSNGTEGASNSVAYQNLQSSQVGAPPPPPPPPAGNNHVAPGGAQVAAIMREASEDALTGALAAVGAENNLRNQADSRNAALLGFGSELAATQGLEMTAMKNRRQDLISELEENRYLVILMAYDFQELWKHKKHKLLWVTRLSVRERGTDFTKVLPAMVKYGSQYFGQESHGLLRKALPQGQVEVGEIKSLGEVPEK